MTNPAFSSQQEIVFYNQDNQLEIHSSQSEIQHVMVYDISGRLLVNQNNINNKIFAIAKNTIQKQVVLITTILKDGTTLSKKYIF